MVLRWIAYCLADKTVWWSENQSAKWKTVLWCIETVNGCCKWRSESIEVLCKHLFSHMISARLCSGNRLWWKIVFLFFGTSILALRKSFFVIIIPKQGSIVVLAKNLKKAL